MLSNDILPAVEKSLPSMFRPLTASNFDLGKKTPQLGPLIVYNTGDEDKGVEINLGIKIDCETNITLDAGKFSVGINALIVTGNVCFVLRPLINKMPIVG